MNADEISELYPSLSKVDQIKAAEIYMAMAALLILVNDPVAYPNPDVRRYLANRLTALRADAVSSLRGKKSILATRR